MAITVETGYEQGRTLFAVPANGDYFIRVYPANRFNRARYTLYVHTLPLAAPYVGSELSVSSGHITDPDGVSRATAGNRWAYQWYRVNPNGFETLILGSTSSTYTPNSDEIRQRFRAEICYRDDNSSVALECRSTRRSVPVQPLITVPHDWSSIPSGLNTGDRFRLLFVSKDKRIASASSIYTYRNWIRSQAENGHTSIRGYKDHFTVLGSTRGNSAKDHAIINFNDQYAGVPIYWLGGTQAADDYADFCDGSWDHSNPGTDSAGAAITFGAVDLIYTGTLSTCERSPNNYLGATNVTVGQPSAGSGSELQGTTGSGRGTRRLYGISFVFEIGEAQTSMQQQANSPAEGSVRISGTPQVGQTLAANSAISDPDGISGAAYAYQWYAGDSEIAGATEILYTLTSAEQGKRITVTITFTDDAEHEETLTSEPTAAVTGLANNAATGQPTITGTAQVGQTLNASTSGIADADGLTNATYAYQWLSGPDSIANATAASYTLTLAEGGRQVALRVTFTDDAGNAESLTSEATAAVADANGLSTASFSYQWLVTVDGTDQEIAGATAADLPGGERPGRPADQGPGQLHRRRRPRRIADQPGARAVPAHGLDRLDLGRRDPPQLAGAKQLPLPVRIPDSSPAPRSGRVRFRSDRRYAQHGHQLSRQPGRSRGALPLPGPGGQLLGSAQSGIGTGGDPRAATDDIRARVVAGQADDADRGVPGYAVVSRWANGLHLRVALQRGVRPEPCNPSGPCLHSDRRRGYRGAAPGT